MILKKTSWKITFFAFWITFKCCQSKEKVITSVEVNQNVSLWANPPLISNGEWITLSWEGVQHFSNHDLIAITCGPTNDINDVLRFEKIGKENSGINGSIDIAGLYMMRCKYIFQYLIYDKSIGYTSIQSVSVPMKDDYNAPFQGHLSFTDKIDEMAIMFNSASWNRPAVAYGTSPHYLNLLQNGTSTSYAATDMCQAPATITSQVYFRDPGVMHQVILSNLSPNTTYYYRYGNHADGWSEIHSFVSRPVPGLTKTKFLACGDMGNSIEAYETAGAIYSYVTHGYNDFLLHFGDTSYADGRGSYWDSFYNMIEPYATLVPFMVNMGNHEYDFTRGSSTLKAQDTAPFQPSWGNFGVGSGGECGVPLIKRSGVPTNGNNIFWYSFNYGPVHIIQISTEQNFTIGSDQYEWLQNDLTSVDRSVTPFVLLSGHRYMYSTAPQNASDQKVAEYLRANLELLLYLHKVDVVISGHEHNYQRTCPVYQGECRDGPVYIIAGTAGHKLSPLTSGKNIAWSEATGQEFGFLTFDATKKELLIQFIQTKDESVYDSVTLRSRF